MRFVFSFRFFTLLFLKSRYRFFFKLKIFLGTIFNGWSYDTSHFGLFMETFTPPCPLSTSSFFGKNKTWNANQIEEKLPNHISIGTIHHFETGSKSGTKKNYR